MDAKPVRIQRKRTKGWKAPAGAIYVGRPSRWGNFITVEKYYAAGCSGPLDVARQICADGYRAWLLGKHHWSHGGIVPDVPDLSALRGHDLMCWCPEGAPCHADVLLELANKE